MPPRPNVPGLRLVPEEKFFPHDLDVAGGFDAQTDLITGDADNGEPNVVTDDDRLVQLAAENQHGI
jgi:hypothetical protein